jgi:hypothetical protein
MRVLGPGEKQSAVARTLGIPEEDFSRGTALRSLKRGFLP